MDMNWNTANMDDEVADEAEDDQEYGHEGHEYADNSGSNLPGQGNG